MLRIDVETHPLSLPAAFFTDFPRPLGELSTSDAIAGALRPDLPHPRLSADDAVRAAVRDLLRHGGFKPTGRSKPASEYLARAAVERGLSPINPSVDAANAVSLHSGLPISVVDADALKPPLRIGIAGEGSQYVFNPSGQRIDVAGLLGLSDADGPCANAVKDAQRTKTTAATRRTLTIVWGYRADEPRLREAVRWLSELLASLGGVVDELP